MIVLDASAVIEIVLMTRRGRRLNTRLDDAATPLHAPHLLSVEVAHGLRRLAALGEISAPRAGFALRGFPQLPIRRWEHEPLLARVWQLRSAVSAYDGVYVALAEALGATLVTADARLGRSSGHRARIELIAP